jgi:D-arginine dehydrogenase
MLPDGCQITCQRDAQPTGKDPEMPKPYDVIVVGGGMAGVSVGGLLADLGLDVAVIEQTERPPQHSSARSVALYSQSYADTPAVSMLIAASEDFMRHPPPGFTEVPLLAPRETVHIAGPGHGNDLRGLYDAMQAFPAATTLIGESEVRRRVPFLTPDFAQQAILEKDSGDLDPAALWSGYRKLLTGNGGKLLCDTALLSAARSAGSWIVHTTSGELVSSVIINAAGAWADVVASRCGVMPLGLKPLLRTALVAETDGLIDDSAPVPFVFAPFDSLYFRAEVGGRVTMSPADEIPSPPTDAKPRDGDVSRTMRTFERMAGVNTAPIRLVRAWAGLRTFAADRTPVIGFDPNVEGFFWLAGQGGSGIEGAPSMAALAASQIAGEAMPYYLREIGFDAQDVAPVRLHHKMRVA